MAKRATLTTPGAKSIYSKSNIDSNFSVVNVNFDNFVHLSGTSEAGNSMLGDFDMGSFEIINAAAPSVGSSLATKAYVDQVLVIGSTTGTIGSLVVDADGDTKVDTEVSADLDRLDLIAAASGGGVAGIQLVGDDATITSLANPYIKLNQHVVMAVDARIGDAIAADTYIELTDTAKPNTILFVAGAASVVDMTATEILVSQNIEMAVGKKVGDLDNDTYIVFNEGSDDDTVRIYAGGVEKATFTASTVSISVDSVSGNFAIGGATNPTGATKAVQMVTGTTGTTASDLIDNQVSIYSTVVTGIENKLNFDFKTGASTKATVELGEDSVFPNDVSIGNDLVVTANLAPATMSGTIGGTPLFTTLGGAISFTGAATHSGAEVFSNALGVTTNTITERTAAAGVTIDGFLIKDNAPDPTSWPSFAATFVTQTISSSANTQLQFDTEEFDTNSDYDHVTNYRFTPTVAGKYLVIVSTGCNGTFTSDDNFDVIIAVNSTVVARSRAIFSSTTAHANVSGIFDMNGTTDFVEGFVDSGADISYTLGFGIASNRFQACRIA